MQNEQQHESSEVQRNLSLDSCCCSLYGTAGILAVGSFCLGPRLGDTLGDIDNVSGSRGPPGLVDTWLTARSRVQVYI